MNESLFAVRVVSCHVMSKGGQILKFASRSHGQSQFTNALAIALTRDEVFIADRRHHIDVYARADGAWKRSFGSGGKEVTTCTHAAGLIHLI